MNTEEKILIKVGCAEFLLKEIETLRRQNEILNVEKRVTDNFFNLVNQVQPKQNIGYGEDLLWQAKKEIEAAKYDLELSKKQPLTN